MVQWHHAMTIACCNRYHRENWGKSDCKICCVTVMVLSGTSSHHTSVNLVYITVWQFLVRFTFLLDWRYSSVRPSNLNNRGIIIEAAISVQSEFDWDSGVKVLTFTSHWVSSSLNRANMWRRKITTDDKKIPVRSEILHIMGIDQDLIKQNGLSPCQILNMDETAHSYAIGPDKMCVPPDQSRAQNIGIPNDKLRITAVVAVFGTGEFAPLFLIIKHSVSSQEKPDQ